MRPPELKRLESGLLMQSGVRGLSIHGSIRGNFSMFSNWKDEFWPCCERKTLVLSMTGRSLKLVVVKDTGFANSPNGEHARRISRGSISFPAALPKPDGYALKG